MIVRNLIEELKQKEIELSFSEGKLKYSGPEENITPEILTKLKENKASLIKYLWPDDLSNLMPINPVGSKVPLFIVHGDNGNYIISDYLGSDQPVFGFFHPGSEGEKIPYRSITQMARSYIEKIRKVSPTGPYYLVGYSFGGNLAFEMAVELQKEGLQVPCLILIDSVCPITKVRILWEKGILKIIRKNILGPTRRWIKSYFNYLKCELCVMRNIPVPFEKRNVYLRMKYSTFLKSYHPGKYSGEILLFRATENTFSYRSLGWEKMADKIHTVELGGKHLDVFIGKQRVELIQKEIEKHLLRVNG